MNKVHILPPEIISKIAAGEVIERPASCIKELIENSLDAHAKSIEISLEQAGKKSISIKDTGSGIEPEDLEKIFKRHSTSKIHSIEDLFAIHSLGFRGEALYSIAAISDIILQSKTTSSDNGWEIHLRGGEKKKLHPVSMSNGTNIQIKEIFFNTPARKKFLKSDSTELQQTLNIFTPYTLLYPAKRFSLTHNDKSILNLPPEKSHLLRIEKALNIDSKHILETKKEFPDNGVSIKLFLGDINIQRPRKNMQFIFINNRPVQNRSINFHINQVYRLLFPPEAYPFFSVYIDIPPDSIDVNIHPTKREVKIKNEPLITSFLRNLCEQLLMSQGKPKEIRLFSFPEVKTSETKTSHEITLKTNLSSIEKEKLLFTSMPQFNPQEDLKNKLINSRYIGPFLNKYLFFESNTSLLVVDQHAAQERITYEKLLDQINSGHIETQHLLTPIVISLTPQEKLKWVSSKNILKKIGLETTLWDKENIALHTHPQLIKKPENSIRNILSGKETSPFDTKIVAQRACRDSVMAGDKISRKEAENLCKNLIESKDPFTCPHGRPTIIEIREKLFEKEFLRG